MTVISEDELLDELRTLAWRLQRHPYTHDMTEYGAYSPQTYQDRFGSWNAAIEAAGLADLTAPVLDEDDLLAELQQVAPDMEMPPTHAEVEAEGPYSPWLYIDRFESWRSALAAAGFETRARTDPIHCCATESELEAALQQIATTINRTPTATEMDTYGDYSSTIYRARFSSWESAVKKVGLQSPSESRRNTYSDAELLSHLREIAADLGRPPTIPEINEQDGPSALTYQYRFETWHNAIKEAGLDPTENATPIPDEDLLEELTTLAADLDRTPTREHMVTDGAYSPTTYERRFGSWNAAIEAAGLTPNTIRRDS